VIYSGQPTMTHGGAYDLRRVTNWLFGIPDWIQTPIVSSASLQLDCGAVYLLTSLLQCLTALKTRIYSETVI